MWSTLGAKVGETAKSESATGEFFESFRAGRGNRRRVIGQRG